MNWPRWVLPITVIGIFSLGLVMVFNTSSAEVLDLALDKSTHHAVFKQLFFAGLSTLAGVCLWLYGYQNLLRISFPLILVGCFFLLACFLPGVGVSANGARRWIRFAGFTLQPSEFMKFLIPLYCIRHFSLPNPLGRRERKSLMVAVGLPLLLIGLEPDNGCMGILLLTLLVLCGLFAIPWKYWALPMLILGMLGGVMAYRSPYVSARLQVYLHPELDLRGKGHQPHQARIAAGSGQVFGKGPGKSLQKLSYLPEAQNDYIAAIYGEEFGFVGMVLLITLYLILTYTGFHIAHYAPDVEGLYLAGITTYLISIQAFLNLGVVSGLLPSTGLNLPFFSQGGSSLLANTIGVAVLLSIWEATTNPSTSTREGRFRSKAASWSSKPQPPRATTW